MPTKSQIMNALPWNQPGGKKDTILFYAAFILMSFAKAFGLYSGVRLYYLLFVFCAGLLALRILLVKKDWKTWLKLAVLLVPSGLIFLHNRETILLFTCLFLAASMDVDFEFSIKCSLTAHLLMVPLCVGLYFCGVVEGGFKEIYVPDGAGGWILDHITYGYGYPHPNALFAAVFIGAVLLLYLNRDRLKLPLLLAVSAVVFLAFWVTECKTGLLVYLALMVALALRAFLPRRRGLLMGYCLLMILGALILGAVLPLIHSEENPLLYFVNHYLISGRLHQGKDALTANGISLLGTGGVFLDMLYMDILINSGIVGALMLYLGMGILVYRYCKDGNDMGMICIAAMILYGCMEQFPLNIVMNPFILYLGTNVLFVKKPCDIH